MATIRTAIELQDNFTGVLYQIIDSVNLGLSAMEDLRQTMNSPVDTASMEAARDSINQAASAAQRLDEVLQGMNIPIPDAPANPFQWRTNGFDVYTNSGLARYEREVQSINNMLDTLNQTQGRIVEAAAQMDLFPADAAADMHNVQIRLQAIQQRIHTIENNPVNIGTDTANMELEYLREQLDRAIQEQEALNRAVDGMDVRAANEAYLRLQQTIGSTEQYIRDNIDEQGRFNREIEEGTNEANRLMHAIGGAVAAYATIHTVSAALDLSDQLTSTTARLNLMNDGLQNTQDLQNMIFYSAERARGSYQATADAVSKLGLMAGDTFSSSEEIVAFMEQVNKQFTIAGTEAAGIEAAMLQLTQAMGSGVLRGEEYNSILEQAPNIIQTIADYLEVPKGQLRELAAEGQITAEIVKAAMFAAADETNEKFESMPMTFEQVLTSLENTALMALQPLLENLNEVANSDAFRQVVNHAAAALSMLVAAANPILDQLANSPMLWDFADRMIDAISLAGAAALKIFGLLVDAANVVADNWSWLAPIILGVAGVLAVYYGWLMLTKGAEKAMVIINGAVAIAKAIMAAVTMLATTATWEQAAAQWGLNAAMTACPIVWIIGLVIILVAVFYAAVAAVNHFAGTSVSATGIICGAFMFALAAIGNLFVAFWNVVADVFVLIYNLVAAVANFIGNVFNDPVAAICRLFFDLADTVLGILQALASAIDTVFGSNLSEAVQGWRDSLGGWVDDTFGAGSEIMAKINADDVKLGRFEYGAAWDLGYSFGERIANFDPLGTFNESIAEMNDYEAMLAGIGSGIDDIAGNTGRITDGLDMAEEDLRYLRDIAEREQINRYTTAEIHIEQHNENHIGSDMDVDGIMDKWCGTFAEQMNISAEGVHE